MSPPVSKTPRGAFLLLAVPLLISACGGGGSGVPDPGSSASTTTTQILAQKGPFLAGATITAFRLAADGSTLFDTRISVPLTVMGSVQISLPWQGPTLLEVEGRFFDELRKVPSIQAARLRSAFIAGSEDEGPTNVNLFTHLVAERVLLLLEQGMGFGAAMSQAREEIRQLFDLTLADGIGPGALDITEGGGPLARDNAQLLYFSGLVLSTGSVEIVSNLAEEFATNGQLAGGLAALAPYRAAVDLESLADHLETLDGVTDAPRAEDLANETPPWIAELNIPVARPDTYTLAEDTGVSGQLAANDAGLGDGGIVYALASAPSRGSVSLEPDGRFTYTPAGEFSGTDAFTYSVTDRDGDHDQGQVTLDITPVSDLPRALPDTYTLAEDTGVSGQLAANDAGLGDGGIVYALASAPSRGSVSLEPDGRFTYTPAGEFSGTDVFTYSVTDRDGDHDQGQVTLDITPVNDPPVARFDALLTNEDAPLQIDLFPDVLANDGDADGDPLSIHSVQHRTAKGGAVEDAGGEAWSYRPAKDFWGLDSFDYTISDDAGERAVATVTVFVLPVDDRPQSNPDGARVREGLSVTLNVLENDIGLGDGLAVLRTSKPARGKLTVNPDESITYIADFGFFGEDSFTYTIEDTDGDISVGGVTITVECADCGSATLSWVPPTKKLDGSELTDLAGYKVYLGNKPGEHEELARIDDPSVTNYAIPALRPGKYFFVVTAFRHADSAELESPPSNEVNKGIPCAKFDDPEFPGKPEPPPCALDPY
jgi:hypothetical protein